MFLLVKIHLNMATTQFCLAHSLHLCYIMIEKKIYNVTQQGTKKPMKFRKADE